MKLTLLTWEDSIEDIQSSMMTVCYVYTMHAYRVHLLIRHWARGLDVDIAEVPDDNTNQVLNTKAHNKPNYAADQDKHCRSSPLLKHPALCCASFT